MILRGLENLSGFIIGRHEPNIYDADGKSRGKAEKSIKEGSKCKNWLTTENSKYAYQQKSNPKLEV